MPEEIKTLLIDDRESDADYVRNFLKKLSSDYTFHVVWETDPTRALLRLTQEPFDLILLDYQMPSMNGLDVLSKIREAHRSLPVIMLTGMGDERIAVDAMKRGAHDYLKKDQMSVADLARAVITVLERRRLENELEEQRSVADRDLRMARELQQAFLPQSFPHFAPQQKLDAMGLRFYHHYNPTLAVGGDFFDVVPIDDNSAGVFVSDVAGHGIQAALVTAALRTLIEELKDVAGDPECFLTEVNSGLSRILRQTTSPLYASAFYLKIDLAEKRVSFCNAGHPPQLHLRRKREEVERLFDKSKTGPVLGLEEDAVFPPHTTSLDDDDAFVLFTDGIIEVPNPEGELFGIVRLEAAAKQLIRESPRRIVEYIVEAATRHAGTTVFPDDVCLVTIEASTLLVRALGEPPSHSD
jgi:serine phosphatase RsbU (regulator of sigma subunit)